jgi:hypothetical protein
MFTQTASPLEVVYKDQKVGSLHALTCSIARENGRIGIAGTLAFDQFDKHAFLISNQGLCGTDPLPEFDVNLTFVNEAGGVSSCKIGGIILVNDSWGYTLDELTSEAAYTYVARAITPLDSLTGLTEHFSFQAAN